MSGAVLDDILKKTIDRITSVTQARQIFLFGSTARGMQHENSDIDLMVVVPSGVHRRKTAQNIYRNLIGLGFAVDIVVVTEDDVEKYRDNDALVIRRALAEGRLIHAA